MATRQTAPAAVTLIAANLAAAPAIAQDRNSWYVGGSTENTHVEVFRGLGWEAGASERGFSVRGGWQVNRNLDLELASLRATNLAWSEHLSTVALAAHTTFDVSAVQASAVGRVHLGQAFEAYGKAGIAFYDVGGLQVLDTLQTPAAAAREVAASGSDLLIGMGLAIKASPKWRVRIEYQWFEIDPDFLGVGNGDSPSIDTFSIGLDYRLSAR